MSSLFPLSDDDGSSSAVSIDGQDELAAEDLAQKSKEVAGSGDNIKPIRSARSSKAPNRSDGEADDDDEGNAGRQAERRDTGWVRETVTGNIGFDSDSDPNSSRRPRAPRRPSRVDQLENQVERLSLICEAMWDLLSSVADIDISELSIRVEEMASGSRVGHLREAESRASACPSCGKATPGRNETCLFCSARPSASMPSTQPSTGKP